MYVDLHGLGSLGAWYDGLGIDLHALAEWARRMQPGLPADDAALLAQIVQTNAQGGGFVAGGQRYCPSNRAGGVTEPLRSATAPCPPGSGGMTGEQVREITAADVTALVAANIAREQREALKVGPGAAPRPVEVYGVVVDGTGSPVAGASVVASGASATSDAMGAFSIVLAAGKTHTLAVRATGFAERQMVVATPIGVPYDVGAVVLVALPASQQEQKSGGGGAGSTPWYKNKWTWIGGLAVTGSVVVGVAVSRRRRRRG